MTTFRTDSWSLDRILKDIETGEIQLPEFQRSWVWDDFRIRDLLASVSQGFPIGTLLSLETGSESLRFEARRIEGVTGAETEPGMLILDGQQRLTALFQSLKLEKGAYTLTSSGSKRQRYYYLDMEQSIEEGVERIETVRSCGEDHQLRISDYEHITLTSPKEQYEHGMFPTHKIFDGAEWRRGYFDHYRDREDYLSKMDLYNQFEREVIDSFKQYNVPVIELNKETPVEAICRIFEQVNTRGVTLSVFELLTATFAADKFGLRKDWKGRQEHLNEYPVLDRLSNTDFMTALTLLATNIKGEASCSRKAVLDLKVEDYKQCADRVTEGFVKAARFLHQQYLFRVKDLPYTSQLIPLAAILADLDNIGESEGAQQNIARWFWCSIFNERYAFATRTQSTTDFLDVTTWVGNGQDQPEAIMKINFSPNRLRESKNRRSAVYKGVYALLMSCGCLDFLTGMPLESQTFFEDNIDIHHIFPKKWCNEKGIKPDVYDSIINKTALSASTNRIIGGHAPSVYLPRIQEKARINDSKMDGILESHLICPEALRNNDFEGFFHKRETALLNVVKKAMNGLTNHL